MSVLIVVFGRVATGKTTLVDALERHFAGVVYRKDDIKEAAFDVLGVGDRDWAARVGSLGFALTEHLAQQATRAGVPCILEGNLQTDRIERLVRSLPDTTTLVLVRCVASDAEVLDRFERRIGTPGRSAGHRDDALLQEYRMHPPQPPEWPDVPAIRVEHRARDRSSVDETVSIVLDRAASPAA